MTPPQPAPPVALAPQAPAPEPTPFPSPGPDPQPVPLPDPGPDPVPPPPPDPIPPVTPGIDPPPGGDPAFVSGLAGARMGRRLTAPFQRGAGVQALRLNPADASGVSMVDAYDFAEYTARFEHAPQPRYVIAAQADIPGPTTVTVTYQDVGGGPALTAMLPLPNGALAGESFAVGVPESPTVRVTRVSATPAPAAGVDRAWSVTALLGTMAKLLWVIGAERDALRGHARRTVAQRHLLTAIGPSLDLIGSDLGVPRFPPLPHGFDADTVALYHLDEDAATAATGVLDVTGAFPGRTGHPGVLVGAVQAGRPGRFGTAMGFAGNGATIRIASSPAFDLPGTASTTVECFVRPDASTGQGSILIRQSAPGASDAGWDLSVGDFGRGLARNVRLSFFDGHTLVQVFADTTLPTDAFTHLAGVLDRTGQRVALYVNGVLHASARFDSTFGAISGTQPLSIGHATGQFRGIIDEVRLSSVVRPDFAPVLGEADEHYRRRLRLFRRWSLPTPANLAAALNQAVGKIADTDHPLVVDDVNATLVRGTRLVHVRPVTLLPGECIDFTGRRDGTEAEAVGTAAAEDSFDPAFLLSNTQTTIDFGTPPPRVLGPGEPPPDPHRMQIGVANRLAQLVTLSAAETDPPGRLFVASAFDPRADDLRATGRAVVLGHSTVGPGRLAALAHRAGFEFVCYRPGLGSEAQVYAAAALGDYLEILLDPENGDGRFEVGKGVDKALAVLAPRLPVDAFVRWVTVPGGTGAAIVTPEGAPGSTQQKATVQVTAAGQIVLKADVTFGRHTVSATRAFRIGFTALADQQSIAADGTHGVAASVVERPDTFFDPVFLAQSTNPAVNYGAAVNNHLMQPAVAELLDALVTEVAGRPNGSGQLSVLAAVDPAGDAATAQGRRLLLTHPIGAGLLASAAFAVGFGYVARQGDNVEVRQPPGQLVAVRGPSPADTGAIIELDEGDTMDVVAAPAPSAVAATTLVGPPPGGPPRLAWSSGTLDQGGIALSSSTQPTVRVTATAAGTAWVQASYQVGGEQFPYTFQVRLRPELDVATTSISKDQYDLIMNILNTLHPISVEVNTAAIRSHVVEIRGDLRQANPEFTFPKFRVRRPLPRAGKGGTSG
ncbi:LamG-like jellyroll fold domain-containing protein [Dactylosporangium sp. CA-092794]|uniref:LamG-like jellyroll fold domain-containing protein n=1 Tax=Dactylosporangium sp. CA-092794 TaxID=3239929 RepID=UPI003D90B9EE